MDNRIALTDQKIQERLLRDVKKRIRFDVLLAIMEGLIIFVFCLISLDCYLKQDVPAMTMVLGMTAVFALIIVGSLCAELVTILRMKRRIHNREYVVFFDTLIRCNENIKQIGQKPIRHPGYGGYRSPTYVDEYLFESGMKYVRLTKSPDEFDLRGIMQYSDDPIPFIVVAYKDRPSAPVLLYNARVFQYTEKKEEDYE